MSYPLFEIITLTVGAVSILTAVVATCWSGHVGLEAVAQLLLLVVLVGAVHRGRKGGVATALFAIVTYVCMRMPLILRDGLAPDVLGLILVRVVTYAAIGIGGGILCSRIRQFLARLDGKSNIDEETQLFSERFIARTMRGMVLQHERYGSPFGIVLVGVPGVAAGHRGPERRRAMREIATHIRGNVRLVDDVGRLDDSTFVLVLPETHKDGASVAAGRVQANVREFLGGSEGTVSAKALAAPEEIAEIVALRDRIDAESPDSAEGAA